MAIELPPRATPAKKAAIAGGGATAVMIALGLATTALKPDEGKVNHTYLDIVKVPTECYGHVDYHSPVGTKFSDAQCDTLLASDVSVKEKAVIKCVPVLQYLPYQLAASTRLAFNIGQGNFCKSGSARSFNAGNILQGCQRFAGWVKAGGKVIPGLVNRRQREIAQCMVGLK